MATNENEARPAQWMAEAARCIFHRWCEARQSSAYVRSAEMAQIIARHAPPAGEQKTAGVFIGDTSKHGTNCNYWDDLPSGASCSCGLDLRRALQTEQTMHNAWRKRAEEAEAENAELTQRLADSEAAASAMRERAADFVRVLRQVIRGIPVVATDALPLVSRYDAEVSCGEWQVSDAGTRLLAEMKAMRELVEASSCFYFVENDYDILKDGDGWVTHHNDNTLWRHGTLDEALSAYQAWQQTQGASDDAD